MWCDADDALHGWILEIVSETVEIQVSTLIEHVAIGNRKYTIQ